MAESGARTTPLDTVLAATDFSDTAHLAVEHAAALARRQAARLILVHGHTMGVYWVGPAKPLTIPSSYEESVLRDTREQLDALAARLREEGVEVDTRLVSASGTEATLYVAKETDADLIVTGTRGHTGFKHLLLGSTAEEIVRTARCPVLSIHPGDEVPAGGRIRIVLPTDFSDDATLALEHAVELLSGEPSECELVLVHVLHTPALLAPMVGDIAMRQVFVDQAREKATEGLEELAEQLRAEGHEVKTRVFEGDPAGMLADTARDCEASMIAMGTRGLTGLKRIVQGSVADRTVRHASCPVLTVPRRDAQE